LHHPDPGYVVTELSPDPKAILWNNLYMSKKVKFTKWVIAFTLLTLLFLFWSIPIAFVAALSNLETLSQVPFLKVLVKFVELNALLKGFIVSI
jgi:hypothetical protein